MLIKHEKYKVNFIDENDNFVGFDDESQCCEEFWWEIINESGDELDEQINKDFIKLLAFADQEPLYNLDIVNDKAGDETCYVAFALTLPEDTDVCGYLVLYNYHNGYYAHYWDYKNNLGEYEGSI